ncbi:MAG: hypothetical protein ABF649_06255 [Bacillus sp. (in: firmicutes)]
MLDTRVIYNGSAYLYKQYVCNCISGYKNYVRDANSLPSILCIAEISKGRYSFTTKSYAFLKTGDSLVGDYIRFHDGSILSLAQTFRVEDNECIVETSIITFAKSNNNGCAEYVIHFDTVENVPNHPDFHFQFEYSNKMETPRIDVHQYESIGTVVEMLIRDAIVPSKKY